ncbi:hypothetical protein EDD85DRAFT_940169 [Armillaria nabsnona]|nr:hypothetical protein EDD85DRAFT_940169 [Armillaria nabsnona]
MSSMATMSILSNLSVFGISVAWPVHCGSEMEMVVDVVQLEVAIGKTRSESESNKVRPGMPYSALTQSNLNLTTSNTPDWATRFLRGGTRVLLDASIRYLKGGSTRRGDAGNKPGHGEDRSKNVWITCSLAGYSRKTEMLSGNANMPYNGFEYRTMKARFTRQEYVPLA